MATTDSMRSGLVNFPRLKRTRPPTPPISFPIIPKKRDSQIKYQREAFGNRSPRFVDPNRSHTEGFASSRMNASLAAAGALSDLQISAPGDGFLLPGGPGTPRTRLNRMLGVATFRELSVQNGSKDESTLGKQVPKRVVHDRFKSFISQGVPENYFSIEKEFNVWKRPGGYIPRSPTKR